MLEWDDLSMYMLKVESPPESVNSELDNLSHVDLKLLEGV